MTIYVVMIEDRHTDPKAYLFSTATRAIAFAESLAEINAGAAPVDPEAASMTEDQLRAAGWLFYRCYSAEGDSVWVIPEEIDEN